MRKLLALLAVVAITACDSRIGGSFVAPTNNILGTFVLRTFNGKPLPTLFDSTATSTLTLVGDTLTFNSDGSVRDATAYLRTIPPNGPVAVPPLVLIGSYSLKGTALDITLPTSSGVDTFPCTYIGGTITLNDVHGTWVYTR